MINIKFGENGIQGANNIRSSSYSPTPNLSSYNLQSNLLKSDSLQQSTQMNQSQQITNTNSTYMFLKKKWEKCPAIIVSGVAGVAGLFSIAVKIFYK